jgi:regulator of sirC expression with transglutaminase-like and TPR domain
MLPAYLPLIKGFMDTSHRMDDLTFQHELGQLPIDLTRAALGLARGLAYPTIDVNHYMQRIKALAEAARLFVPEDSSRAQALALADFLFNKVGLAGNKADYWDPRNSFLNEVLDRQLGIPISLASVYLDLAGKLEIPAYGIGLPGHFIVGLDHPDGRLLLDPFSGGTELSLEDCRRMVRETTGYHGPFMKEWLAKVSSRDILIRMLNNLRGIYIQKEIWPESIRVVGFLRLVQPDHPAHLRDLGLLHYKLGSLQQAVEYLGAYLQRVPEAQDKRSVRQSLKFMARELARLN